MNEHELFRKSFSGLHASNDTLAKVMEKSESRVRTTGMPKRFAVLAAVMVMLFSTAFVTYAAGLLSNRKAVLTSAQNPGEVIQDAYGTKISSQKPAMEDAFGNPIEMPTMDRVAVDPEKSEKLIGAYISDVDGAVTVGDNIFTLKNFLIDEAGIGMFIWTVENPNGITYTDTGYGMVCFSPVAPFAEPQLHHFTADGEQHMTSMETALISRNDHSTALELVSYFGTYANFQKGDSLVWSVGVVDSKQTIQITPAEYAPTTELSAEGNLKMRLTSQGVCIRFDRKHEFTADRIVIQYKDGTQYCVKDDDMLIMNTTDSYWRSSDTTNYGDAVFLFNRIIDVDHVASVAVGGHWLESVVHGDEYDNIRHEENYVFFP